jgi:hypothetical protein
VRSAELRGLTNYGGAVAKSCSVRIVTDAVPVPLTFNFHLNREGKVEVIDNA